MPEEGVPDAARVEALLADRRVLAALRVRRVVDADDQFLGAPRLQRVRDVGAELVVTALVVGDLLAVDIHLGLPVDGAEVQLEALAVTDLPALGDREGAAVPHAVLVALDAGELRLDRVGHEDLLVELLADRWLVTGLRRGELPLAVEVLPGVPGELRARVLGVGVLRAHLVRPLGAQFVLGVVRAAAPELADGLVAGAGQPALAVVRDIGLAGRAAALLAHDRLLEPDEQGAGVGRVGLDRGERPLGAADHGLEVIREAGRRGREGLREVELEGTAVLEDGRGYRPVVVPAVGQPEGGGGDRFLGLARLGPAQMEVRAAEVLEVLDLDVIRLAGRQLDGLGVLFLVPVVDPVVDGELAVDPEPEAVVAGDGKRCRAGLLRYDLARPAHTRVVGLAGGRPQPRLEGVEVEFRVEAGGLEFVEVEGSGGGLGVVLALQAVGFDRVVGRCRRR